MDNSNKVLFAQIRTALIRSQSNGLSIISINSMCTYHFKSFRRRQKVVVNGQWRFKDSIITEIYREPLLSVESYDKSERLMMVELEWADQYLDAINQIYNTLKDDLFIRSGIEA